MDADEDDGQTDSGRDVRAESDGDERAESSDEEPAGSSGEEPPARRPHDVDALQATQEEARAVVDHQIRTFDDLDDNAAKTSRLNLILLGLALTAGSFLAQTDVFETTPYLNTLTGLGVLSLVASFVLSVVTYTTTDVETGLGSRDVERLIDSRYTETEWLSLLLRSEASWMRENERRQDRNSTLLTTSHAFLVLGVFCLTAGAAVVHR